MAYNTFGYSTESQPLVILRTVDGHFITFQPLYNARRWSIRLIEGPLSLPYDSAKMHKAKCENGSKRFTCQVHICALYAVTDILHPNDWIIASGIKISYKAVLLKIELKLD